MRVHTLGLAAAVLLLPGAVLSPSTVLAVTAIGAVRVEGPAPAAPTDARLLREDVHLECPPDSPPVRCSLVATLTLANPTDTELSVKLAFSTAYAVGEVRGALVQDSKPSTVERRTGGATVTIPPNAQTTVELRVAMNLWDRDHSTPLILPALRSRHLLLGDEPYWHQRLSNIIYAPGAWSEAEVPVAYSRDFADGWEGEWADFDRPGTAETAATAAEGGGVPVPFPARPAAYVHPVRQGGAVFNGGPFVAVGASFERGFRLRVGYDVGFFNPYLLASLSAETGFDDLVIAALFEVASPQVAYLLPTLSLGVGLPIRVTPVAEVGFRVELSLGLIVAFVATFDHYPGDNRTEVALFGRVSL